MEVGVHLPLIEFGDEGQSAARLHTVADGARDGGFAAVAANDHFLFAKPWLDGLVALAAVIDRTEGLELATTVALASLRGPVPLGKALAAIDLLSGGRLVAGVGPGSSRSDYEAVAAAFEDRWPRFDEAVKVLRAVLNEEARPASTQRFPIPAEPLAPSPSRPGGVPIWIGSWGSDAGLRRVARLADGWLASAYNTTPARFADAHRRLVEEARPGGAQHPPCRPRWRRCGPGSPKPRRGGPPVDRGTGAAAAAGGRGARGPGLRRRRCALRRPPDAATTSQGVAGPTSGRWATSDDSSSCSRRGSCPELNA